MKKFLFSFTLLFCFAFSYAQTGVLRVQNGTNQMIFVHGGSGDVACTAGSQSGNMIAVLPNAIVALQPQGPATYEWKGVRAFSSPGTVNFLFGSFNIPLTCGNPCDIDYLGGLTANWVQCDFVIIN